MHTVPESGEKKNLESSNALANIGSVSNLAKDIVGNAVTNSFYKHRYIDKINNVDKIIIKYIWGIRNVLVLDLLIGWWLNACTHT